MLPRRLELLRAERVGAVGADARRRSAEVVVGPLFVVAMNATADGDRGVLVNVDDRLVSEAASMDSPRLGDELLTSGGRGRVPPPGTIGAPLAASMLVRRLPEVAVVRATDGDLRVRVGELCRDAAVVVPPIVLRGGSGDEHIETGLTVKGGQGAPFVGEALSTPLCMSGCPCRVTTAGRFRRL